METKIPNLGQCSIDSLKIRIPTSELKDWDKLLNESMITVDAETKSIIDKEFKRYSQKFYLDNFSLYASIENIRISSNSTVDCVTLLINSKQLGSKYFDGITLYTIPIIYELVTSLKIIECSFDTFMNAGVTDIDFKKDFYIIFDEYKELIEGVRTMTRESKMKDSGHNPIKGKMNYGIEWSKRKTTKYLSAPFLKIYHKHFELSTPTKDKGSLDFANRYLSHIDTTDIIRVETTVKNKEHLKRLEIGLKEFNLKEILSLSVENKDKILSKAFNTHLLPRSKSLSFKNKSELTPANQVYLKALLGLINEANFTFNRATNYLINSIDNASSKSKTKKQLLELYNDHIKGTDYDAKSTNVENILDGLGWF
tara:strand:+ start:281 stop:1384 length:1104 start_codon:yes stop_codon:yes gene_type:complete